MKNSGVFWLASYPKSGNTWVRCLVCSLLTSGAAPALNALGRYCPNQTSRAWMEEILGVAVDDMTEPELRDTRIKASLIWGAQGKFPRCLKVHDRYDADLFPSNNTAGTVYILRDPRDVAPSWADHRNRSVDDTIMRMSQASFSLAQPPLYFANAPHTLGSWSGHVASWLDHAPGPLLLLRYEEMLAAPQEQIARLADFLGLPSTPELVAKAVAACGFQSLRALEERDGFAERMGTMERFFRQGRAGGWRDALTPAQAARIIADHGPMMARLGYDLRTQ